MDAIHRTRSLNYKSNIPFKEPDSLLEAKMFHSYFIIFTSLPPLFYFYSLPFLIFFFFQYYFRLIT